MTILLSSLDLKALFLVGTLVLYSMEALVLIWFLYMYSVQFAWAKGSLSVYH